MKIYYLLLFFFISCKKNNIQMPNNVSSDVESKLIKPKLTNDGYNSDENEHYIVRNASSSNNKLVLFIGGSNSIPKNYNLICDHAASLGFDVISLSYQNSVPATSVGNSRDELAFDKYRDEVCFGNPVSNDVSVNELNSIFGRTVRLLIFLQKDSPAQNWSQYLGPNNTLKWNKIVLAGHSQGSGHAGYLAKKNTAERLIMLSGPNDYNTTLAKPGNWLYDKSQTPVSKQFALLHTNDELVSFGNQVANLKAIGILAQNKSPFLADNSSAPFNNEQALSVSIAGLSNHNVTVGRNPKLKEIWSYLFLD
jgi:hypothetical protein